jgi:hypothetical protein
MKTYMEITGYKLREALKQWAIRKTAAEQAFPDSLHKFDKEEKDSPTAIVASLATAETAIVELQVAQMRYNLAVTVKVEGLGTITLAEAIKLAGSADRIEKLWRGVNLVPKRNRYDNSPELVRDPTQLRATPTMEIKEVLVNTSAASKRAGALRAAIASSNAASRDIADLNPALFE